MTSELIPKEIHVTVLKPSKGREYYDAKCAISKMFLAQARKRKNALTSDDLSLMARFGFKIFYDGKRSNKLDCMFDATYEGTEPPLVRVRK